MSSYDYRKIQNKLYKELDNNRYQHTLGVMYTSAALAMVHQEDLDKAQIAGLLHDCAKCIPHKKKIKMCKKNNIQITSFEERNPFLLHAKLGAYLAKVQYKVQDPDVLGAIKYHTTGRPGMTKLEKIIYIADYIEPMRNKASRLDEIRKLAFQDLDECVYAILKDTLDYLEGNPKDIDQMSIRAYYYYKDLHEQQEETGGANE